MLYMIIKNFSKSIKTEIRHRTMQNMKTQFRGFILACKENNTKVVELLIDTYPLLIN